METTVITELRYTGIPKVPLAPCSKHIAYENILNENKIYIKVITLIPK